MPLTPAQLRELVRLYMAVTVAMSVFFVAFVVVGIIWHRTVLTALAGAALVAAIFYLSWLHDNYRRLKQCNRTPLT